MRRTQLKERQQVEGIAMAAGCRQLTNMPKIVRPGRESEV